MALRAIMLRRSMDKKRAELEELRTKDSEFETRETELMKAIDEAEDEESEAAVSEEVEKFEKEKEEHENAKTNLQNEINGLEEELKKVEEKAPAERKERKEKGKMENRTKFFDMSIQEREAFFANEEVKTFLQEVRVAIKEKRALTNVGLTIPEVMLPLLRQVATEESKLIRFVTVRQISGTSRQNILGEIPEAYWDDMCASLKELDLAFYNMEMDGYKVSGYFAVCNAIMEDSDLNLAQELIYAIGKAIGKALDKAILYGRSGKNVKMPMGIVTSLTTKTAPSGYPNTAREWKDLSTSNVKTGAAATGTKLFQDIVTASGVIDNDYDTSEITWVMNKKTHMKIMAESIGVNSSAAIVAGMGNAMPVVGGEIVELSFVKDDTIIFGYFKNYILVERAGTVIDQSEHVRFIEDQTVFRGRARYDGNLAIREAFGIYGVGGAPDTEAPLFAGETAEPEETADKK